MSMHLKAAAQAYVCGSRGRASLQRRLAAQPPSRRTAEVGVAQRARWASKRPGRVTRRSDGRRMGMLQRPESSRALHADLSLLAIVVIGWRGVARACVQWKRVPLLLHWRLLS